VVSIDSHKKPPAKKDEEKPFSPINIKHQLLCVSCNAAYLIKSTKSRIKYKNRNKIENRNWYVIELNIEK